MANHTFSIHNLISNNLETEWLLPYRIQYISSTHGLGTLEGS